MHHSLLPCIFQTAIVCLDSDVPKLAGFKTLTNSIKQGECPQTLKAISVDTSIKSHLPGLVPMPTPVTHCLKPLPHEPTNETPHLGMRHSVRRLNHAKYIWQGSNQLKMCRTAQDRVVWCTYLPTQWRTYIPLKCTPFLPVMHPRSTTPESAKMLESRTAGPNPTNLNCKTISILLSLSYETKSPRVFRKTDYVL